MSNPEANSSKPDALQRISDWIASPKTSTGSVSALRRMNPAEPERAYPAIYQLLGEFAHAKTDEQLARWALLIHCIALVRGSHRSKAKLSFGAALFEINYSELRLQQLLRADFDVLRDLLPRIARRIYNNGLSTDWWNIANLLLDADAESPAATKARQRIVREYLSAQAKKQS